MKNKILFCMLVIICGLTFTSCNRDITIKINDGYAKEVKLYEEGSLASENETAIIDDSWENIACYKIEEGYFSLYRLENINKITIQEAYNRYLLNKQGENYNSISGDKYISNMSINSAFYATTEDGKKYLCNSTLFKGNEYLYNAIWQYECEDIQILDANCYLTIPTGYTTEDKIDSYGNSTYTFSYPESYELPTLYIYINDDTFELTEDYLENESVKKYSITNFVQENKTINGIDCTVINCNVKDSKTYTHDIDLLFTKDTINYSIRISSPKNLKDTILIEKEIIKSLVEK